MNANVEYKTICDGITSDRCSSLIINKNPIMKLNNDKLNQINNFVGALGNYERGSGIISNIEPYIKDDVIFGKEFFDDITKINFDVQKRISRNFVYDNGTYYIERTTKSRDPNNTKLNIQRTDTILKSDFFGTGNVSVSVLFNFLIKTGTTATNKDIIIGDVILKIYPLQLHNHMGYESLLENRKNSRSVNEKMKKRLENLMKIVFYKEALINCYIKDNIIIPKISNTFVCTNDIYIAKGLPISYPFYQFTELMDEGKTSKKLVKRWLKTPNINMFEEVFKDSNFGFIEMEKADITLHSINILHKFDLGMLFEILYTKLCLAHVCNIYITDDHFNNIMVKFTEKIRKYVITRRGTTYTYYITNNYQIKYIDMERFDNCSDRNIFLDTTTDILYNYYYPYKYSEYGTISCYDPYEQQIAAYMFSRLGSLQLNNIDTFCDFMNRCLPSKYLEFDFEELRKQKGLNKGLVMLRNSNIQEMKKEELDKLIEKEINEINDKMLGPINDYYDNENASIKKRNELLLQVQNIIYNRDNNIGNYDKNKEDADRLSKIYEEQIASSEELKKRIRILDAQRLIKINEISSKNEKENGDQIERQIREKIEKLNDDEVKQLNSMIETFHINLDIEPKSFLNDFNKDTQIPIEQPYIPLSQIHVRQADKITPTVKILPGTATSVVLQKGGMKTYKLKIWDKL